MREIKFRGKRIDNGKWIYGSLIVEPNLPKFSSIYSDIRNSGTSKYLIYPMDAENGRAIEVIPKTVGQFIGLKDTKNKKDIYEADIVKSTSKFVYLGSGKPTGKICIRTYQIVYLENEARYGAKIINPKYPTNRIDEINQKRISEYYEIIGDIYQNPELLKEAKKE